MTAIIFDNTMEVPMRNTLGEIIKHAIVSPEDYDRVMKYRWSYWSKTNKNTGKITEYVNGYIDKENTIMLSHFIMGKPAKGYVVDHISRDRLDNRRENLRFATLSQNAQNTENMGGISMYRGVIYIRSVDRWRASSSDRHLGHFLTDREAAIAFDKYAFLRYGKEAQMDGFVEWSEVEGKDWDKDFSQVRTRHLPKNIQYFMGKNMTENTKYRVRHTYKKKEKTVGYYATIDEAQMALNIYLADVIQPMIDESKNIHEKKEITRNKKGQAVITLKNKYDTVLECIVDDDTWHELTKYSWHFCNKNYVSGYVKGKRCSMHRYLCGIDSEYKIDHINNIPYDNRRSNLRYVGDSENGHNKTKKKGCSSKYHGVSWEKTGKKWRAYITKDKKRHYLGSYDNEIDAARAYNQQAKIYYGTFAKLNDVERIQPEE
jgi:hypothetical protein